MNRALLTLTARQLLRRKRSLFILLLALVPVLVAAVYRLTGDQTEPLPIEFATGMLDALVIAAVLPLIALVLGTGALGAEIEDGTAVYLLTKPIARWRIVLVKIVVAAGATIALSLPPAVLASVIVLGGDEAALTPAFAAAAAAGALVYCALFVALSVLTSRALLFGLAYIFIWEGVLPSIFDATRWISVRQYMLGIADLISGAPRDVLAADLDGGPALIATASLTLLMALVATRLLRRFEIGQRL